ncbi:hypothetical protein NDU88_001068 [Pleurodeles waltl]|uniref:Uncharacterized protein n=1 Tax=Pleurodeles waltl TaxID=8319 RepID=A0AAV7NCE5_PLEWA|nr:hypothetical protein NDU88_001068 [Pleurodeles waltl]
MISARRATGCLRHSAAKPPDQPQDHNKRGGHLPAPRVREAPGRGGHEAAVRPDRRAGLQTGSRHFPPPLGSKGVPGSASSAPEGEEEIPRPHRRKLRAAAPTARPDQREATSTKRPRES